MSSPRRLPVGTRLLLLVSAALLGIAALTAVFLVTERALIKQERESAVRQAVETAHGIVAHFEQQARQGQLSHEAAQQQALAAVRGLRYSGNEYFWVQNIAGNMLMHPIQAKLNGSNMSGFKDPDGKLFFQEMIDVVKASGAGFVSYQWPKPGSDSPQPKLSYVKGVAGWQWIIGSGVYIDNINATMVQRAIGFAAGALVLMVALLALGWAISRGILRQLGGEPDYAASLTQRIASGDLATRIEIAHPGEHNLLGVLQAMRDQLAAVVQRVRDGADELANASARIADGNQDLAHRTEAQASALEETAASMHQISHTVQHNVEGVVRATQLATDARSVAARGGEEVARMVDTMQSIHESSSRIADIIGVIDGIAVQTNILALNAAVEAARAGEQGRGFAVVATEVRALAGRSAAAAKAIKGLINTSVARVTEGSSLASHAGATMSEVVDAITQVADIMAEIQDASSQQATGINQVGEAVGHMDQVTQQNGALVEAMAHAATELKQQADALVHTMSVFKLGSH